MCQGPWKQWHGTQDARARDEDPETAIGARRNATPILCGFLPHMNKKHSHGRTGCAVWCVHTYLQTACRICCPVQHIYDALRLVVHRQPHTSRRRVAGRTASPTRRCVIKIMCVCHKRLLPSLPTWATYRPKSFEGLDPRLWFRLRTHRGLNLRLQQGCLGVWMPTH